MKNPERIEDKLYTLTYKSDHDSHLVPNPADCAVCRDRSCTIFCPAKVYVWNPDQKKLTVSFENCVECGACRIGCDYVSIDWRYPRSGFGVTYKKG